MCRPSPQLQCRSAECTQAAPPPRWPPPAAPSMRAAVVWEASGNQRGDALGTHQIWPSHCHSILFNQTHLPAGWSQTRRPSRRQHTAQTCAAGRLAREPTRHLQLGGQQGQSCSQHGRQNPVMSTCLSRTVLRVHIKRFLTRMQEQPQRCTVAAKPPAQLQQEGGTSIRRRVASASRQPLCHCWNA